VSECAVVSGLSPKSSSSRQSSAVSRHRAGGLIPPPSSLREKGDAHIYLRPFFCLEKRCASLFLVRPFFLSADRIVRTRQLFSTWPLDERLIRDSGAFKEFQARLRVGAAEKPSRGTDH